MAENSAIVWTDHTFNPWEGCQKISPGCDHCYAETRNARFSAPKGEPRVALNWGQGAPRRRTSVSNWRKPLAWQDGAERFAAQHGRRQRVFCASLADVFDNAVDPAWRADLFELIRATPGLDWLLLTKRIGNVEAMAQAAGGLPENVWLGATIVNQEEADRDIPKLAAIDVEVRFLSMEPLLGPVELHPWLLYQPCPNSLDGLPVDPSTGQRECCSRCDWTAIGDVLAIHWVIVGGESGDGARPMHPDWVRRLRDDCAGARVPFLFKQWGEWLMATHLCPKAVQAFVFDHDPQAFNGAIGAEVGKKAAGRLLDGVEYNGYPERSA